MFILQVFFFGLLCRKLLKEFFLLDLISLKGRRGLEFLFLIYFLFLIFYLKNIRFSFLFCLLPLILILLLLGLLKKQEEKNLFFQLSSLLLPLESQMKLGLSFINAWQKGLEDLKSEKIRNKIQKITEILKFQNGFYCSDKKIENFVKDLMHIHQSSNPLKRLQHLQRKVRIEHSFQLKSRRALFQIRIQSGFLSLFYLGLLAWTSLSYGSQYIHLILISLLFFCIGLFWIFKTGKKMKWSV